MATRLSRTDKNSIGKFLSEYISHHQSSRQAASAKLLGSKLNQAIKIIAWCDAISSPFAAQSQESCDATASKSDHNQLHVYTVNIQCKKSAQVRLELASGHGHHVYICITHSFKCLFYLCRVQPCLRPCRACPGHVLCCPPLWVMHGEDRLRARWHGQGPHRLPRHWVSHLNSTIFICLHEEHNFLYI